MKFEAKNSIFGLWLIAWFFAFSSVPSVAQEVEQNQSTPSRFFVESNEPADLSYLIGPGDQVLLTLFKMPDYSGEYQILSDGTINLPMIGSVLIANMTLEQAASAIALEYQRIIRRPVVTLDLVNPRPLQVAIAGEISRPGSYILATTDNGGQIEGQPTVTQAIQIAGGITQSADVRRIQVRRRQARNSLSQNAFRTVDVNLWRLLKEGDLEADFLLQDGDQIFIPEANSLSAEETTELASASFSPDSIVVNVVGEVESPGAIQVPPNTPMNQAILAAGGFTNRAQINLVKLIRLNPNGTVSEREIAVDFSADINSDENPPVRPNDTIIIGRSGIARLDDTLGTVLSPVNAIFSILNLFDVF